MKINSMYVRPNREDLEATKVPCPTDIAWAAGLYEGEGHVRLCGSNSKTGKVKRGLAVSVPQKDPQILYWMRDMFGGSVCSPNRGNPCFTLNICGDRARIFLALIYRYMSDRRKDQINATCALDFLQGAPSRDLSARELKDRLSAIYAEHKKTTYRGNPEAQRVAKAARYARKKQDPEFAKRIYEQNKARRENMTEEQKETARKLAREKYVDTKVSKVVNITRIDATA